MADMNEASWIDANVEVVKNYLKKEFDNFGIAHRDDASRTHTFTVDNGKKQFTLCIGWPILADRGFTQARIDRLLKTMWLRKCGYMERTGITGRLHRRTLPSVGACDRPGSFILYVLNAMGQESGSKKKVALVEKRA